jgi:hypothetical protein
VVLVLYYVINLSSWWTPHTSLVAVVVGLIIFFSYFHQGLHFARLQQFTDVAITLPEDVSRANDIRQEITSLLVSFIEPGVLARFESQFGGG